MATSADDYLGTLQGEAEIDSTGVFSIDLERAGATLQRFQLPSAYHYVLPLVACAVVGGAEGLSIFPARHSRVIDISGLAFDFQGGGAALGYLQLALATAARLADTQVLGESWDGRAGSRFRMWRGKLLYSPLVQPPWDGGLHQRTRLTLTPVQLWDRRLAGAARWLVGVGPASDPAAELLKAYSRYSPVPIRLDSRELNVVRQGHWKLLGVLNRPPLQLRPLTALRQIALEREVPFAGYLGQGVGGGGVLAIVDGLLYPVDLPGAHPEFRAIVWHSGLQRDLSLLKLVENDELQRFRQQLGQIVGEICSG